MQTKVWRKSIHLCMHLRVKANIPSNSIRFRAGYAKHLKFTFVQIKHAQMCVQKFVVRTTVAYKLAVCINIIVEYPYLVCLLGC